jgi:hypothetical protein
MLKSTSEQDSSYTSSIYQCVMQSGRKKILKVQQAVWPIEHFIMQLTVRHTENLRVMKALVYKKLRV